MSEDDAYLRKSRDQKGLLLLQEARIQTSFRKCVHYGLFCLLLPNEELKDILDKTHKSGRVSR